MAVSSVTPSRKMRKFLMTTKKLTEDEAISLITIGVDFGITQVVPIGNQIRIYS